jgi:NDP-sugar pyrophosphorylase family protein
MYGSTVELGPQGQVSAFRKGDDVHGDARQYKTVNIYSISLASWKRIEKCLGRYVSAGRLGEYYEVVFAEMIADGTLSFDAVFFDADRWYEIDTRQDLRKAENLFTQRRVIANHSLMVIKPAA